MMNKKTFVLFLFLLCRNHATLSSQTNDNAQNKNAIDDEQPLVYLCNQPSHIKNKWQAIAYKALARKRKIQPNIQIDLLQARNTKLIHIASNMSQQLKNEQDEQNSLYESQIDRLKKEYLDLLIKNTQLEQIQEHTEKQFTSQLTKLKSELERLKNPKPKKICYDIPNELP